MRILCETNIPPKYADALANEDWITVETTTDYLDADADDQTIAEFAKQHGYVLFVRDSDFLGLFRRSNSCYRDSNSPETILD